MKDSKPQFGDLNSAWQRRRFDRRRLVQGASLMGISLGAVGGLEAHVARAQEGTPVSEGTGEAITSLTREEYYALLDEEFPFEEPQNTGGQVIFSQTSDIATVNGLLTADFPTAYITTGPLFEPLVTISPIDGRSCRRWPIPMRSLPTARPTPFISTRTPNGMMAQTSPPKM